VTFWCRPGFIERKSAERRERVYQSARVTARARARQAYVIAHLISAVSPADRCSMRECCASQRQSPSRSHSRLSVRAGMARGRGMKSPGRDDWAPGRDRSGVVIYFQQSRHTQPPKKFSPSDRRVATFYKYALTGTREKERERERERERQRERERERKRERVYSVRYVRVCPLTHIVFDSAPSPPPSPPRYELTPN